MILRIARVDDAEAITELVKQLGYEMQPSMLAEKLRLFGQSPNDEAFVATENQAVIGCIRVHTHELFHAKGRLGRITSLVVRSDKRRAGVGTALIAVAERFFETSGCVKAEVTSGDHRESAHRLDLANGFVEDERRFAKPVSNLDPRPT